MTQGIVGRPKRARPTDRTNYKLDSDIRTLLTAMAARKGRSESTQIEQLILQGEAIDRLKAKGESLSHEGIEREISAVWVEITSSNDGL